MKKTPAAPTSAAAPVAAVFIGAAAPSNAIGLPVVLGLKATTLPVPVGNTDTTEGKNPLNEPVVVGTTGAEPSRSASMMLRASLITDPKSLCIGAGMLLAQDGSGVAVAKFTTKDIEFDSKAC